MNVKVIFGDPGEITTSSRAESDRPSELAAPLHQEASSLTITVPFPGNCRFFFGNTKVLPFRISRSERGKRGIARHLKPLGDDWTLRIKTHDPIPRWVEPALPLREQLAPSSSSACGFFAVITARQTEPLCQQKATDY